MKGRASAAITVVLVIYLIAVFSNTGWTGENEQLVKYYKKYISNCICKNESKAALLQTSKSVNLRKDGAIYKQKAVFLTNHQNVLVDEMIRKEIGKKPYKVDYYLNKKFNGTIK
jgi:hypothetical protein